jgi:hypothetical protein
VSFEAWLAEFRKVHEEAKRGALKGEGLAEYLEARNELARALLAAQHVTLEPGMQPRQTLRAARALQADLTFFDGSLKVATRTLSAGGFAAVLPGPQRLGDELKVTLRVPGGEAVQCEARVVESKPQAGNAQVSFKFVGLSAADAERLEFLVFDAVLEQLRK